MPVEASSAGLRVAAVLTALASSEGRDLPLSELARLAGVSKATCQSMVLALVQSGYVARHETRKTYRLGPAVLALTTSAGEHRRALELARVELQSLSAELDVETVATVVTDRSILKVARVLRPSMAAVSLPVGRAAAFVPPFGASHLAWSREEAVTAWLERGGYEPQSPDGKLLLAGLEAVRTRGYSVALGTADTTPEGPAYQLVDIEPGVRYPVIQISAPIFHAQGQVALVIGLMENDLLDAEAIDEHAQRLLRSTRAVTRMLDGLAAG